MPQNTQTQTDHHNASSQALLVATNLSLQWSGDVGVNNISLNLHQGDILGLLGLNGAGKSTTLRLLSGVLQSDSGKVLINGHCLTEEPLKARQCIGFLPDTPPLYQDMRVQEYVRFCAKIRRVPHASLSDAVKDTLQRCDLNGVKRQRIATLSKGYRQRVGLAQALVHKPAVLLLDEPSNGLDPQQMAGMRELVQSCASEQAVIFSTHLLGEAQALCNRIALMHHGKLIHQSTLKKSQDSLSLEQVFENLLNEQSGLANSSPPAPAQHEPQP